jgi:hypothetical protein
MKFSLSNEEIKENLERIIKQLEKELMLRLAAGGIDFEDFDPVTFQYNPDSGVHSGIAVLVQKIDNTKEKLNQLKDSDN